MENTKVQSFFLMEVMTLCHDQEDLKIRGFSYKELDADHRSS